MRCRSAQPGNRPQAVKAQGKHAQGTNLLHHRAPVHTNRDVGRPGQTESRIWGPLYRNQGYGRILKPYIAFDLVTRLKKFTLSIPCAYAVPTRLRFVDCLRFSMAS